MGKNTIFKHLKGLTYNPVDLLVHHKTLLSVGKENADVSPRLMWTGQKVRHCTRQGSAPELPQLRACTGASAAGQGWKVWNHPSAFRGTGSRGGAFTLPPTPMEPFPLQPCGFMSKHSACGHAMTSEEKYTWFLSDVRGYGFINWWNTCQQKPLSSPAAFRSYWQMYCFQRPCVENLCSTLFFVPPEITRFLLRSIITSYLIEMWPDQNKAGPLKGLQRGGHLPCKNCTRAWWIGCFQSFFRCIKKKITAIRLTTERFLPIFKTIIAHDVWVTNTS